MPSVERGLWGFLTSNITNLRMYPDRLPQGHRLPAATYQRISTAPDYTHQGDSCADDVRVQISVFASSRAEAEELATIIRDRLSGIGGNMGGVRVGRVFLRNRTSNYEPDGSYYVSRQDFSIGLA